MGTIIQPPGIPEECRDLAIARNVLERFVEHLHKCGHTGEDRAAKILYLALTSRSFSTPISVAVKGPSSGGKSQTVGVVLKFFPEAAHYTLTGMSEKAIAYSKVPLIHRHLVIFEAAGLPGRFGTYGIRSLLSEHCIRYEVTEKQPDGTYGTRLVHRPGPTGLITTTTLVSLHPENETRILSVPINDTAEQTRDVMKAIAEAAEEDIDFAPWHALQDWLVASGGKVTVPFGTRLATRMPPVAIRLRRDFTTIINLIKAHALLHRATREINERDTVVATLDDYAAVRALVADLIAEGVKASVSPVVRETVQIVGHLMQEHGAASLTQICEAMGDTRDKSAISRRVQQAQKDGYLIDLEEVPGRPSRLVLGEPLPDDVEVLPPPEALM